MEETTTGDGVIVWTIPFYSGPSDEIVNKFNRQLEKDGYSFSLMFKTIDNEKL